VNGDDLGRQFNARHNYFANLRSVGGTAGRPTIRLSKYARMSAQDRVRPDSTMHT
jgi:hypothetical protein